MVDKDQAEINSIRKVFSESYVLLCWYHVIQVILILITSNMIFLVHLYRNMNLRKKSEMFHCQFKNLKDVCKYFRNHWETIGHLWSNFRRCYKHRDSDTNNLIERYISFLCMFTALCICGLAGS
uniref:Uncharacterized protein n=1 Tax=Cyprinus carpio carpio TaxID=630221 RepID=A0A9J8DEX1_CYPCA